MERAQEYREKILSVRNLSVHYVSDDERLHALNGVSLDLSRGETLGLVGETGAGKTTIARSIMRTLSCPPAEIVAGEITLFDDGAEKDLLHIDESEMRKVRGEKISMIFQDPMTALNPVICVGRQIAEGIKIHEDISWRNASERAKAIMEMVGISPDRFREYPYQFSGGMKQRVVIAIALACNPDILIADEPTTALDVTIQAQVLELIKRLQAEKNAAMILITHDLGVIAENCDNVAVIYAGQIVEYSNTRQLFKNPSHPYTQGLFAAIPSTASKGAKRLNAIKGAVVDLTQEVEGCFFAPRCPHATAACYHTSDIPEYEVEEGHRCRCLLYEKKTNVQERGSKSNVGVN